MPPARTDATPSDRLLALSRAAHSVLQHYILLHSTVVEAMKAYDEAIMARQTEGRLAEILLRMGHQLTAQINQNALGLNPADIAQITETFAYYRAVAAKNRRNAEYMRRRRAKIDGRYAESERAPSDASQMPEIAQTRPYYGPRDESGRKLPRAKNVEIWEIDEARESITDLGPGIPELEIAPDVLSALDLGSVGSADERAELAKQIESDKQVLEELRREGKIA